MDLGAYAQIGNLEAIMQKNGINVPRLRGLRMMSEEEPISKNELKDMCEEASLYVVEDLCCCNFNTNANWSEYSSKTDALRHKYIKYNKRRPVAIKWNKLHGKRRKAVKYAIKKRKKAIMKQFAMWNKYAGHNDVLYIHARLGAGNWNYYDCDKIIKNAPWYLDHVEDNFDRTYVDIFAKVIGTKESEDE